MNTGRSAVFAIFGGVLLALAGGIAVAQTQSADGGLRIGIVNTDEFSHLAKDALTISVLRDDKVYIQSVEIPPSELTMKLSAILNAGRNGRCTCAPTRASTMGQ